MSMAYHPQTDINRAHESMGQHIWTALCMPAQWKWIKWLSLVEFLYNLSYQSTLGRSPYEVLYGHAPWHFGLSFEMVGYNILISILGYLIVPWWKTWSRNTYSMLKLIWNAKLIKDARSNCCLGVWVFFILKPYAQASLDCRSHKNWPLSSVGLCWPYGLSAGITFFFHSASGIPCVPTLALTWCCSSVHWSSFYVSWIPRSRVCLTMLVDLMYSCCWTSSFQVVSHAYVSCQLGESRSARPVVSPCSHMATCQLPRGGDFFQWPPPGGRHGGCSWSRKIFRAECSAEQVGWPVCAHHPNTCVVGLEWHQSFVVLNREEGNKGRRTEKLVKKNSKPIHNPSSPISSLLPMFSSSSPI